MKYLRKFDSISNAKASENILSPGTVYVEDASENFTVLMFDSGETDDDLIVDGGNALDTLILRKRWDYLTFTCVEDGGISLSIEGYDNYSIDNPTIEYSKNGGTWTSWDLTNINMVEGDIIKMRGVNEHGFAFSDSDEWDDNAYAQFVMTGEFNVSGNLMSLIDGKKDGTKIIPSETFETDYGTIYPHGFGDLFCDCESLIDASELALSATTLCSHCYQYMFYGCTSLINAPEELPATILTNCCYESMFSDCTSLTEAPELPATTLTNNCYYRMFSGCTSLNSVKCLATDISATDCTSYWLYNVSASGTFTKASSMSSWTTGVSGIPSGWTIQSV